MKKRNLFLPGLIRDKRLNVDTRKDGDGAEAKSIDVVSGYGAIFYREDDPGSEYWLWDDVVERIMPGAFDRALAEAHDVRSFFNHDANLILGRASAGTLDLSVDATGLRYAVTPSNTEVARHVVEAIRRGDVDGSSFMFRPTSTAWREVEQERDGQTETIYVREIEDLTMFEVGAVVFPAYESTTAAVRSAVDADPMFRRYHHWLDAHVAEARAEFAAYRRNSPASRESRRAEIEARCSGL